MPLPPMTRLDTGDGDQPPGYMTRDEKQRFMLAANHVHRLYPGPAGKVLARELWAWWDFGWRLAHDAPIAQLVEHILDELDMSAA